MTSGKGEGEYYIGLEAYQTAFEEALGFRPFPGTLNLEVDIEERKKFEADGGTRKIRDVRHDGDRLSNVDVTPCKIQGVDAGLLRLEFTDHPLSTAEVVAPVNLREKLGLEDGERIEVDENDVA